MFACRSDASTKSEVESSTIAVVVRVSSTAGSLVARGRGRVAAGRGPDRVGEPLHRAALLHHRDRARVEDRLALLAVASAVRQTIAAPEAARTARVAAAPSRPGRR